MVTSEKHSIKKIRLFSVTACATLLFSAFSASADDEFTLERAIHDAMVNSPQIKAAHEQITTNEWRKKDAFSGHLPQASLSTTYLTNKKYLLTDIQLPGSPTTISFPNVVPTSMWIGNLSLPIFDGFATTYRNDAADDFKNGSSLNFDWQKFQLEREVTLQFYRAIASSLLLEAALQNEKALDDHLKDVKLFKGVGLSTNYDVLRVEVQTSEAKSEVLNAQDNVQMSRVRLAELIGVESPQSMNTIDPKGTLPTLPQDVAQGIAQSEATKSEHSDASRQDLAAMQLKVDGMEKNAVAATRQYYPKISLFAQYQYYNNKNDSFVDTSSYRSAYSAGLSLNWIIFDGLSAYARGEQTRSEKMEMEFNLEAKRRHAKADTEFWRRKLSYYLILYQNKLSEISKSEESVRLARIGQKEGSRTTSDLLDAQSELFRARAGTINAQLSSIEALINLELATGKSLYKFWNQ